MLFKFLLGIMDVYNCLFMEIVHAYQWLMLYLSTIFLLNLLSNCSSVMAGLKSY